MYQTRRELEWLEGLRFDCPKCDEPFGIIVHKKMKAKPFVLCYEGHKSALLNHINRSVDARYRLVGGKDGHYEWN